jgi:hypothetical protein
MTVPPGGTLAPFFAVTEDDQLQHLTLRCRLMRAVSGGRRVRLVAAIRSAYLGGFMPERIAAASSPATAPGWPIEDRVTAESLPNQTYPPRPMLVAVCPGAVAGDEALIAGTFYSTVPGLWPIHHTIYAGLSNEFLLEAEEGGTDETVWTPVSERFGFHIAPGAVDHLEAWIDSDGHVAIGFFDRYRNPAPPDVARVSVAPTDRPTEAVTVVVTPGDQTVGGLRVTPPGPPAPGSRVTVRDSRGRETRSAPATPATPEGYRLLFGDFHWHSEVSGDGTRPLEDAYYSARDGLLLDFVGASDHYGPLRAPYTLEWYADLADRFLAPGRFVTLLDVEIGGPYGHHNIYWTDRQDMALFEETWRRRRPGPLVRSPKAHDLAAYYGIEPAYFDRAQPGKVLIIPHHTNAFAYNDIVPGRPGWFQYRWPLGQNDPRFLRLCEMVQLRGSFETEELDDTWHVLAGAGGGSVRTGLARGFRVGFTGGTDNHCGWPARGPRRWAALTGVYAAKFTRAGIMDALHARRCFATTGARIAIDFRLNGQPMGSEVAVGFGGERRFQVPYTARRGWTGWRS